MSNRLKFFREQMAAFEGTVDPRSAIDSGYYIPEPRKSPSSLLTRVALRPSATHLLIGGIGTGKSTQLHLACKQLNELPGVSAYYIDVSLYTDISRISPGVLTAITGLVLADLTPDHRDVKTKEYQELVKKCAYGYKEEVQLLSGAETLGQIIVRGRTQVVNREGILKVTSEDSGLSQAIKHLRRAASLRYGDIILLFDGLDRLDDIQQFAQIITKDIVSISSYGAGVVLVGPLKTAYSEYRDTIEPTVTFNSYQSCFDVQNDQEAVSFFLDILNSRSKPDFIEQSAAYDLVNYSGGVLRDLINLAQSSIEESYMSDEDSLNSTHVQKAANSFGRAKFLGLSSSDLETLIKVSVTGDFVPRTDEEIRLLVMGRILEYQYPKRRFVVHPTIQPLLQ
jgi:hypothetical protein